MENNFFQDYENIKELSKIRDESYESSNPTECYIKFLNLLQYHKEIFSGDYKKFNDYVEEVFFGEHCRFDPVHYASSTFNYFLLNEVEVPAEIYEAFYRVPNWHVKYYISKNPKTPIKVLKKLEKDADREIVYEATKTLKKISENELDSNSTNRTITNY